MQTAGSSSATIKQLQKKSLLDKRAKERLAGKTNAQLMSLKKNLEKEKAKLVSLKKNLEKPKKKVATGGSKTATLKQLAACGGVMKPSPRKRRGLQALKRCIRMQQSAKSMVCDAPFRRSLNERLLAMERNVLQKTPYLSGDVNDDRVGFNKSQGAIDGLTTLLTKKATDLLRCAASYAVAAGRHAVTDTDVLRAAMQDEDLAAVVDNNKLLRGVLDQRDVDGERTRRVQRELPFIGVKAHIYHELKGREEKEEDGDGGDEDEESDESDSDGDE